MTQVASINNLAQAMIQEKKNVQVDLLVQKGYALSSSFCGFNTSVFISNIQASVIVKERLGGNLHNTEVLLIKRGQPPKMGCWSLPGGSAHLSCLTS